MGDAITFVAGVGANAAIALVVVVYLRPSLNKLLADLCGTQERANFWSAFSCVTLVLVPMIFALHCRPEAGQPLSAVFELATQMEWALIGLVCTVVMLGLVLSKFISDGPRKA
jgi:cobalamin synthase